MLSPGLRNWKNGHDYLRNGYKSACICVLAATVIILRACMYMSCSLLVTMATDAALGRKMPVWSERSQAAGRLLGKGIVPREALSSTKLKGLKVSYHYAPA